MPKVYAVRKGRRTGIFATWAEAEAQVNGFGAAQFKGFTDHAEAQTYLAGHPSAKAPRAPRAERAPMKRMVEKAAAALPPETLRVYTDGGCIGNHDVKNNIQPAGWGVIVTRFGKALAELRGPVVLDAEAEHFRGAEVTSNNTAELTAVAEALIWLAAEKSHDAACILYDSKYAACITQGIYKATANRALAATCQQLLRNEAARRRGGVSFVHVKGHSGDVFNDRADALAGLGMNGQRVVETFGGVAVAAAAVAVLAEAIASTEAPPAAARPSGVEPAPKRARVPISANGRLGVGASRASSADVIDRASSADVIDLS
mmetsp:Transcript_13325/g.46295  ORF Transcript_13325/g.46295 Transcript_13325/m.46295 type:complete len:317 (+) Transcript_13325:64-1014(+)